MTPQLMQAIKLLQLSNLDLVAYVEAELERNPLLDRGAEDERAPAETGPEQAQDNPPPDGEIWTAAGDSEPSRNAIEDALDTRTEDVFPDDAEITRPRAAEGPAGYSEWAAVGAGGRDDGEYNLEAFIPAETTLADWLREQLTLAIAVPAQRLIGQYLIDLVDEAGYINGDLEAAAEKLGTGIEDIERVLATLQSFDPPGICARNLAECLTLQLKEHNRFDPAMAALIARLDLLAKRDFAALKKICGVGDEDLVDMIAEIRRLNPKPGLAFGSAIVQPIVPDVFVRPGPDGGWIVELNSDTLPKVLVNQTYFAEVSATARRDTDKSYLAECLQSATWLVRALDQRARTILKVANEIVRQQDGFFARGVEHLRPLNLKTVAEAISMHEFDGLPRHRQQIHGHQPWHFRAQIFLHLGDCGGSWRRGALGRSRASPHQAIDRRRDGSGRAVRRHHRRQAPRSRHRYRAAHGRQISRSHAHSLLGAAAAREAGRGAHLIGVAPAPLRSRAALTRPPPMPRSSEAAPRRPAR